MILSMALSFAALTQSPAASMTNADALKLLLASCQRIDRLSLEFEAKSLRKDPETYRNRKLGPDDQIEQFSGKLIYHLGTDPLFYLNMSSNSYSNDRADEDQIVSDGKQDESYSVNRKSGGSSSRIVPCGIDTTRYCGTAFRLWMLPTLIAMLRQPTTSIVAVGREEFAGEQCLVLTLNLIKSIPPEIAPIEKYWVVLSKNASIVKYETYSRQLLAGRLDDIVLTKIPVADSEPIYLPIRGTFSTHLKKNRDQQLVSGVKPSRQELLAILPYTVRVNEPNSSARVKIAYKPGTTIEDKVNNRVYVAGQDLRPPAQSLSESEDRLREYLGQGENQKRELELNSQSGNGHWLSLAPMSWIVIGTMWVVLLIYFTRKRLLPAR